MEQPAAKNRRRARRHRPKRGPRVACHTGAFGMGPDVALSLLDLSEGGMRMLVKVPVPAGAEVGLSLEGPGQPRPFKLTATVAWAVPAADGAHCVGLRFQRDLRYADLH